MIKILKSTLKTDRFKRKALLVAPNEIIMNEELMDALNIIEGEIVDILSPSYGTIISFEAYVTKSIDEGISLGALTNTTIFITAYKYMNQNSANFSDKEPIRIKITKDD